LIDPSPPEDQPVGWRQDRPTRRRRRRAGGL